MKTDFGWSYPPGCSGPPDDDPTFCEVCGLVDDCICPECPRCGEQGNPECYQEVDLHICGELYGKETPAQRLSLAKYHAADLKQQWQDTEQYIDYLKSQIEETGHGK